MKKIYLLVILFTLGLLSQSIAGSTINVTLAFEDKPNPPWALGSGDTIKWRKPGISIEILRLVEQDLKTIVFRFLRMPWSRCLKGLEYNRVDGIFNASFKEKRLTFGRYPYLNGKLDVERHISYELLCFL